MMTGENSPPSGAMATLSKWIDALNDWTGKAVRYLVLVSVLTIVYEVISRYVFGSPTQWVTELNIYLLCAYVLLGGGTALLGEHHVRVDLFWGGLSKRKQAMLDLVTSILFFGFVVTLVWKGSEMVVRSFLDGTRSCEAMEWPLYPSQLMVPIGGLLLGLQGLSKLYHDVQTVLKEKS